MSFIDIIDNTRTDKNTSHSYLSTYEKLLEKKKNTAKNILEIGIQNGGSIKLWHDYFVNATIYGLDKMDEEHQWIEIKNKDRIILYCSHDAYDTDKFKNTFLDKNIKFDLLLDDGPHTLGSMMTFIQLYSQIMADDGILIIEDVQQLDWIDKLKEIVPEELKKYVKEYDLRSNKNRSDDILFIIDKANYIDESKDELKVDKSKDESKDELKVDKSKDESKDELKVDKSKDESKDELKVDESKDESKDEIKVISSN